MRPLATIDRTRPAPERKPEWLKIRAPGGDAYARLKRLFRERDLHTVCEEASCPNVAECWGGGTATLMLMGDTCTRGCRFCHVKTGNPAGLLDPDEPRKVAEAVDGMGLGYVVLTSVDRDDLQDGGAAHFAETIGQLKRRMPELLVEVLIPDFRADVGSLAEIVSAGPDVVAHNVETVERLTPAVRDRRATYRQSLEVLSILKRLNGALYTKSSIMLGLGESEDEVVRTMGDLRETGVDVLTLGQYLRPSLRHLPVDAYVPPQVFDRLGAQGERMGFLYVASGPLVRSSYRAGELFLRHVLSRSEPAPLAAGA